MTKYRKTLDFMFSQLPMYQRVGQSAFKKNLDNIIELCDHLGNPQHKFKSIHIAGTNGKGSTTHLVSYGLQISGYKVGVYTSPHYRDFRERIKINGTYIPKVEVVRFISENEKVLKKIKPSFFEMSVALAFDYFAKQKVDYAVIEVGLGGRLDSTNIITPLLSVITNISFDHMAMLGNDLVSIAKEKAGIIKQRVPVVIGETQNEVSKVFIDKSKECQSPIDWADQNLMWEGDKVLFNSREWIAFDSIPLKGDFQRKNILTALYALKISNIEINWNEFQAQFHRITNLTNYLGRWQYIGSKPDVLVDSAHNIAGIEEVVRSINNLESYNHFHFVLGFANDKDVDKLLKLFPKDASYYFAKANVPRGLASGTLSKLAASHSLIGKPYTSVRRALAIAKRKAKTNDLIFVGGSIFVVAEVI